GKDSEKLGSIKIAAKKISNNIQVAISDDGIGMNELTKTRIFDPFFTTKSVGKGTGQGLSMAYSIIVEKHKGKIKVESEENVGSTFTVVIPIS
ncbi:MAG: HAMP domain-containing histidine kinase, partial [Paraglaciecola sp.]|nr:HAMP domain-containing histidine kinase [Paraglaciecola sp.]